jgi:non-ribosomal peptide synthetase component F
MPNPSPEELEYVPLSLPQRERIMVDLWAWDNSVPTYPDHIALPYRLRGPLNVPLLRRALNEVVRRHEALRTTFAEVEGEFVQVLGHELALEVPVLDLRGLGEREEEAARFVAEDALRPFDPSRLPLLRVTLLRLGDEDYVMSLVIEHLIADAESVAILWRETVTLYRTFSAGLPSSLPELPVQYADFAVTQQEWLEGGRPQSLLDYWADRLPHWRRQPWDNIPFPELEMPFARVEPSPVLYRAARMALSFSPALATEMRGFCARRKVTAFMLFLAALKLLLFRYTGREGVGVCSATATRDHTETEGLIGYFASNFIIHTDLSGDPTFARLLERVRESTVGAVLRQDLPISLLRDGLRQRADTPRPPHVPPPTLVRVPLVFINMTVDDALGGAGGSAAGVAGFEVRPVVLPLPPMSNGGLVAWAEGYAEEAGAAPRRVYCATLNAGLGFRLAAGRDVVKVAVQYEAARFAEEDISRMLGHFRGVLEEALANPERRLSDFNLLTEAERRRILDAAVAPRHEAPPPRRLHELFEVQAESTPEADALVCGEERVSYCELNRRAERLARRLRAAGVGAGVHVGILLEPSPAAVVSILGTLKAGGVCVPLPSTEPPDTEAPKILRDDLGLHLVLTRAALARKVSSGDTKVVCLDADGASLTREEAEVVGDAVGPEDLACVVHAGGATRGVMLTHESLSGSLLWFGEVLGLDASDRLLQPDTTAPAELLLPLCSGASVVFLEEGERSDERLAESVVRHGITTLRLDAARLSALLRGRGLKDCTPLRRVILDGGELPARLAEEFLGRGGVELFHARAFDETSGVFALERRRGGEEGARACESLRAFDAEAYVLDAGLRLVPVGVPGELYVGGACLARGYRGRPGHTAERLVAHPFGRGPGERVYRTGEAARYRRDGSVEFMGRLEDQVMVRGMRVRTEKVEEILLREPGVGEAAVFALKADEGGHRLVAYVVPEGGRGLSPHELGNSLKARYPEFVVPSTIIIAKSLPPAPGGRA